MLYIKQHNGQNRLFSEAGIDENDEMLFVPKDRIMYNIISISINNRSRDSVINSYTESSITRRIQVIGSDDYILAMFLMSEYSKGSNSSFYLYIKYLPKRIYNSLYFNDNNLNELQNTNLRNDIVKHIKEVRKIYNELYNNGTIKLFFSQSIEKYEKYSTYSIFRWSLSIVYSYGIFINGKQYLIPTMEQLQFINYNSKSGYNYNDYHIIDNNGFHLYSHKKILKDEIIEEPVMDTSNSLYLQYLNGIVFPNPSDCVDYILPSPRKSILLLLLLLYIYINRKSI